MIILLNTIFFVVWILGIIFLYLIENFFGSIWGNIPKFKVNFKIIFWPLYFMYRLLGGKK